MKASERMKIQRQSMIERAPDGAFAPLPGSESGLAIGHSAGRSPTLSRLQTARVHLGLSGGGGHPGIHSRYRERRSRARGRHHVCGQRAARKSRVACVPGNAVRGGLRAGQEGQTGSHRLSGAFIADWARERHRTGAPVAGPTGCRVAVVGSGLRAHLCGGTGQLGHQ